MGIRPGFSTSDLTLVGRTFAQAGSVVAPVAGAAIVQTDQLPGGVYEVRVQAGYGGVADAVDNMQLLVGQRRSMPLLVLPAVNTISPEQVFARVEVYDGERLSVNATVAGVANSVYIAGIRATPLSS